jgi:hypothetical protein
MAGGLSQLSAYGAQDCYSNGERKLNTWFRINRYLQSLINYYILPLLPKSPRIYHSKLKEILNYPQNKELPRSITFDDLRSFFVFRQFNSSEKIRLKTITSIYKEFRVYMIFTTLAGHPILLSDCDKILINNRYRKVKQLLENEKGLYLFTHYEENKYKGKFYISTNIKNITIKMCVENCIYNYGYHTPDKLIKYLKKRDNNREKIRMNPKELEKELIAWYWKPERFELFKWQLDLE